MQYIKLPRGLRAIVDDEDHEIISKTTWHLHFEVKADGSCKCYPKTAVYRKGQNPKMVFMHSLIMPCREGFVVDHKNGNTLDNRKDNLREATYGQNVMNSERRMSGNKLSQFKGVSKWCETGKRWRARIRFENKLISLGGFDEEVEAAKAYDKKALELFGPFAWLNFPVEIV